MKKPKISYLIPLTYEWVDKTHLDSYTIDLPTCEIKPNSKVSKIIYPFETNKISVDDFIKSTMNTYEHKKMTVERWVFVPKNGEYKILSEWVFVPKNGENKIISEKVEKTFKLKGGKFYLISETIYPTPDGCNKKIINYILQYDKEDKIDYVNRIIKELKNDISQLKTEEARYKRLCNNINKKLINTQFKLEELKIEKNKLVNK